MSGGTEDKPGRGFGGLSDLTARTTASIDAKTVTSSAGGNAPALPAAWQGPTSVPEPSVTPQSRTNSGSGAAWGTLIILGLLIAGGFALSVANNESPAVADTTAPDLFATEAANPVGDATPQTAAAPVGQPPPPGFYEDVMGSPSVTAPVEAAPPIGTDNTLSGAQLRYCVFERFRIGGAQTQVDQHNGDSVDRFNAMVDDFNRRCSSFRYEVREYQAVEGEASQRQAALKNEGVQRFLLGGSQPKLDDQAVPLPAAAPAAALSAAPGQLEEQADGLPEFSVSSPYGNGWTCIAGYAQAGGRCVPVDVPENATLDYTGHDWTCKGGFYQAGQQCLPVEIPDNATSDYTGHGWVCSRGFYQAGTQCLPVPVPDDGILDYSGHGWTCNRGFYQAGTQCLAVEVPLNAALDYTGHAWTCSRGYYQAGSECNGVHVPANGSLDYTGHGWMCNAGFSRAGNECQAR